MILFLYTALAGGPLEGEYELWQFHAHWGSDNSKGSEHRVNGKMFASEVLYTTIKTNIDKKGHCTDIHLQY